MKKSLYLLLMVCVCGVFLYGCSLSKNLIPSYHRKNDENGQQKSSDIKTSESESDVFKATGENKKDNSGLFSSSNFESGYDESTSIAIKFAGNTAICSSNAVNVSENIVTITDEGTYILSGSLNDGTVIVDAEKKDKVQLVLDNVYVNCDTFAPIFIKQADKVFITMVSDSVNTLSNCGNFDYIEENSVDAVIYSKEDLTLNGSGSLNILSSAGHGIVSNDELVLTEGTYKIDCKYHGMNAKDSICVANASVNITSGKDGIHVENSDDSTLGFIYIQSGSFNIDSAGDGISASGQMLIDGGTFDIVSGGGSGNLESENISESNKGIRADGNLIINGGTFNIDSSGDAVHSNYSVIVGGGSFEIATDDYGFHANDTLRIYSADININKSREGLEGYNVEISDGNIILYAEDDGINAAKSTHSNNVGDRNINDIFGINRENASVSEASIVISGGNLYINAGGDGINSNGTLTISGGYTFICSPAEDDSGILDYDKSGTINGGIFIGTGSSRMLKDFSHAKQGVITARLDNQTAGTEVTLNDLSGNEIISSFEPETDFSFIIISSPDIVKGKTYKLTIGSLSKEYTAD